MKTNNVNYTVELQAENFEDNITLHSSNNLINALYHYKNSYNAGKDVIMFIEDQEGNNLDSISNSHLIDDILLADDVFRFTNSNNIEQQLKESEHKADIYINYYNKQLQENDKLKKEIEMLKRNKLKVVI